MQKRILTSTPTMSTNIKQIIWGFATVLLFALPALAQSAAVRMEQVVQSYVDNKQFMGSVLVARGGDVLFSKGYGFANLEWNIPNTPAAKFRLGSITKQFTAALILLLEQQGKLKVEDPVKKYVPEAPATWDKITIFHLLTHTSGIPSFTSFPDYASLEPFPTTPEKLLARFRDRALEFQPGEKWNYSNSGYVLLGYLIERISGESYTRFLQKSVFTPLGMQDSGYDSNTAIIEHRASGYSSGPNGVMHAGFIDMSIPFSAGALYSTTEDLLKWEQALFGGKVISPASLQKMTTPFKNDYAFGLQVHNVDGHKVIDHGGGIEGFNTTLAYYPEDKLTVVVLANLNGAAPQQIVTRLASLAHGGAVTLQNERKAISLDSKTLARYVGAYELRPGAVMLVTLEADQLISQLTGQAPVPIHPESENLFFPKGIDAQLEFSANDAQGRATQMILRQNGRDQTAKRLDDAEFNRLAIAAAAVAKRIKEQTAAPGSEAALRKFIDNMRAGTPDYSQLSENLAAAVRQQQAQSQATISNLGAVQSITFKGVGPAGPDIYLVKFDSGSLEFRIVLGADGKITGLNMRPAQ